MIIERFACLLCKGTELKPFASIDSRDIVECCDCGFRFTGKFDTDVIARHYQENYYPSPDDSRMDEWISKNIKVWQSLCSDIADITLVPASLLDIGAGTGGFLMECRKRFPKATFSAIESSENARGFVKNKIPSVTFIDDPPATGSFDVISCLQTLEHLHDPEVLCSKIFNALNKGGIFILTVPNTACLSHLWKNKGSTLCYGNPTHLQFFNAASVEMLLRNSGFKNIKRIVKMHKDDSTLGFSIIRYLARFAGVSSELRYIAVKD